MNIRVGDVCKVNMVMAQKMIGGFGGHQLKILKDVIRQGGGYVLVEEVSGDNAMVSSYNNPASRILGDVQVPVVALRVVDADEAAEKMASIKTARLDTRTVLMWLKGNINRFRAIGEHDEDAIHGEMINDGVAEDTNRDMSVILDVLSAIREEMAWSGEDFRDILRRVTSGGKMVPASRYEKIAKRVVMGMK